MKPILILASLLLVSGCSPLYVLRAGYEEAKILSRRQPIRELVADPRTPAETRAKLAVVLQARDYAERVLELEVGESYTTFSQLDSDTLALVLSAAYQDRFQAYTWWFPIVGHVPYKGFFSEGKARREIARLQARGFDTHLRPTSAFSTLGWFNDPLVSPLLRYDEIPLANTVIHELVHNTVYLPGQAMFNESFANFVGARGAIDLYCAREGEEARECRTARAMWQDQLLFGAFLEALVAELETLYARKDLGREEMLSRRAEIFAAARTRFAAEIRPSLRVSTFADFERAPLNNATLISRRLYYHRLDLFERAHRALGGDLRTTIHAIVQAVEDAEDPYRAVEALAAGG